MSRNVTVSLKIPQDLRERMRKLGLNPSPVLRKALEDEVRRRELQEIQTRIEELKPLLNRLTLDEAVRSIREDRERR